MHEVLFPEIKQKVLYGLNFMDDIAAHFFIYENNFIYLLKDQLIN